MCLFTGNLILVTSPGGGQDKVWCLSGDMFPLQRTLSESQSTARLDGVAWALREMGVGDMPAIPGQPLPPLIVRQHYEPAKKFVLLTPNVRIYFSFEIKEILVPTSDTVNSIFSWSINEVAAQLG